MLARRLVRPILFMGTTIAAAQIRPLLTISSAPNDLGALTMVSLAMVARTYASDVLRCVLAAFGKRMDMMYFAKVIAVLVNE